MTGEELIAAERERQENVEGYTAYHDDGHVEGELLAAAHCYLHAALDQVRFARTDAPTGIPARWPFERRFWNPSSDSLRNLAKAGALIAAEMDRLQRKARPKDVSSVDPNREYRCRCSGCGAVWKSAGEPEKCPNECNGDTIAYEPLDGPFKG